ncbi:hypothetical protein GDO86_018377 [Hymenochirus boettgeri]|uniref:J domain-containing protein n=1 Tax=Hymenochirus boettgeri TaxID=247094 RepID=A0A8T2IDS0_9PIPI|nr:hypothetical protein GDO86_018377 [Hymenochirus boettgeri]
MFKCENRQKFGDDFFIKSIGEGPAEKRRTTFFRVGITLGILSAHFGGRYLGSDDYYKILEIPSGANEEEIKKAYRKMALKYHPDKNKDANAEDKFKELRRPTTVLSAPKTSRLKTGGGSSSNSGNSFHYTFHGDPHATFASFFGGSNPFDIFFGSNRSRMSNGFDHEDMDIEEDEDDPFGGFGRFGFNGVNGFHKRHQDQLHPRRKVQDPPVVHELKVSLEEIYQGCTKRMKITRRRLNPDGRTVRTEDKILNVVIKKGWKEGTKITFPKEGDAKLENIPADIVFLLKDRPHAHFKRDGSNIVYTAKITLKEPVKRLRGEGLPFPKVPTQRGDLIVEFQVALPGQDKPNPRVNSSNSTCPAPSGYVNATSLTGARMGDI